MRVEIDEDSDIVLKEVYNGVVFETSEGNRYHICMRDDTIEITPIGHAPYPRVSRYPPETPNAEPVVIGHVESITNDAAGLTIIVNDVDLDSDIFRHPLFHDKPEVSVKHTTMYADSEKVLIQTGPCPKCGFVKVVDVKCPQCGHVGSEYL
jgi:hypothetical protein